MPYEKYVEGKIYPMEDIDLVDPAYPGVYALYEGEELIYIGSSTDGTVKDRLKDHESGEVGYCTQQATAFCSEAVAFPDEPEAQEGELLRRYKLDHDCNLPKCNCTIPS